MKAIAIDEIQKVLSTTGAHGGKAVIFKDADLSGKLTLFPISQV